MRIRSALFAAAGVAAIQAPAAAIEAEDLVRTPQWIELRRPLAATVSEGIPAIGPNLDAIGSVMRLNPGRDLSAEVLDTSDAPAVASGEQPDVPANEVEASMDPEALA